MGVDCKILIPSDAKFTDVVSVMGIAAGCGKEKIPLSNPHQDSWYVGVKGVRVEQSNTPILAMCPSIFLEIKTIDGVEDHYVMFHGEPGSSTHGQWKLLMPPSTPFWIAIGMKLIGMFGGEMDCNDCDAGGFDRRCKRPRKWNDPRGN